MLLASVTEAGSDVCPPTPPSWTIRYCAAVVPMLSHEESPPFGAHAQCGIVVPLARNAA